MPVPSGSFRSRSTAAGRRSAKSRRPSPTEAAAQRPVAARAASSSTQVLPHRVVVVDDEDQRRGGIATSPSAACYHRGPGKRREAWPAMRVTAPSSLSRCAGAAGRGLSAAGCYDFHLTGPEDPAAAAAAAHGRGERSSTASRTAACTRQRRCDDRVVFFGSWMRPASELPLTPEREQPRLDRHGGRRAGELPAAAASPTTVRVYDPFLARARRPAASRAGA